MRQLIIAWSQVQILLGPPLSRKPSFFPGHFWATFSIHLRDSVCREMQPGTHGDYRLGKICQASICAGIRPIRIVRPRCSSRIRLWNCTRAAPAKTYFAGWVLTTAGWAKGARPGDTGRRLSHGGSNESETASCPSHQKLTSPCSSHATGVWTSPHGRPSRQARL